jgi:hypothetical protein
MALDLSILDIKVWYFDGNFYIQVLCLFFPDFSLSDLKLKNNIVGHVTGLLRDKMLEGLGLTPYLKDPMCSRSSAPFSGAVNGWTNGMLI